MTAAEQEWQPGDPLCPRTNSYRDGLFTFRDDDELEACRCPDAASWPNPKSGRHLPERDELEAFITDWHTWQAGTEGGAA